VQRGIAKVYADIRDLEGSMLRTLSEQTTAEKSSSKTTADIQALQQSALAEELRIAGVQNELAKLQVGHRVTGDGVTDRMGDRVVRQCLGRVGRVRVQNELAKLQVGR
jgi:hypothetical protein